MNENVPNWVTDVVIEKTMPKFIKIPFYLLPHPQMINGQKDRMKKVFTTWHYPEKNSINSSFTFQDRLVANEFIQCRKVCEHVLDKVLGAETTPSSVIATNNSQNSQSDGNSDGGSQIPPEDRIELLCNDVVTYS